jgi:hypothetical protein
LDHSSTVRAHALMGSHQRVVESILAEKCGRCDGSELTSIAP